MIVRLSRALSAPLLLAIAPGSASPGADDDAPAPKPEELRPSFR